MTPDLTTARLAATRALRAAYARGGEAAIETAWQAYQRATADYVIASDALRAQDPAAARNADSDHTQQMRALLAEVYPHA